MGEALAATFWREAFSTNSKSAPASCTLTFPLPSTNLRHDSAARWTCLKSASGCRTIFPRLIGSQSQAAVRRYSPAAAAELVRSTLMLFGDGPGVTVSGTGAAPETGTSFQSCARSSSFTGPANGTTLLASSGRCAVPAMAVTGGFTFGTRQAHRYAMRVRDFGAAVLVHSASVSFAVDCAKAERSSVPGNITVRRLDTNAVPPAANPNPLPKNMPATDAARPIDCCICVLAGASGS